MYMSACVFNIPKYLSIHQKLKEISIYQRYRDNSSKQPPGENCEVVDY